MSLASLHTNHKDYKTFDNQASIGDGTKLIAIENAEKRLQSRTRDLEQVLYEVSKAAFYTYSYEPKLEKLMGSLAINKKSNEIENLKMNIYGIIEPLIKEDNAGIPSNVFKEFYQTVDKVESAAVSVESMAAEMKGKRKCMIAVSSILPVIGWIWALVFYFLNYSQDRSDLNRYTLELSNEKSNLSKLKELPHFQEVLATLKKIDPDYKTILQEIRKLYSELSVTMDNTAYKFKVVS